MKHYREQNVKPEEDFKKNNGKCVVKGWTFAPTGHSDIRFDTRGTDMITSSDWKEFFSRTILKTVGMRKKVKGKYVPIKIESDWKAKDGDEILMWSNTLQQAFIYTVAPEKKIRIITILPWNKRRPNDEDTVVSYVESTAIDFHNQRNDTFVRKLFESQNERFKNLIYEEVD